MTFQTKVGSDLARPTASRGVTVESLMAEAFSPGRQPRSAEYQAGVKSMLAHHIEGKGLAAPYPQGTAQADAFFAGWEEGKSIWRRVSG